MTSKAVSKNADYLKSLGRGAGEDVRDRVDALVKLYKDRKISQMTTAEKLIKNLMSDSKRTVTFAKKRFDKKFEEIQERLPLNQRMAINKNKKDYAVSFQLYGLNNGVREASQTGFKDNQGDDHNLLAMTQPIQMTLKNVRDENKIPENLVNKYIVRDKFDFWTQQLKNRLKLKKGNVNKITQKEFDRLNTREEWRRETGISETPPRRRNTKGRYKEFEVIHKTDLFDKILKRLVLDNPEFKNNANIEDYASAIKIIDISDVTNTGGNEDDTKRKLKDGGAIGIYHYNVRTDLDVNAEDFVKAIERGSHTEGECWINTLIDHYEDTLMSDKKWECKRMTRDKIFKLMKVSEGEFRENGASVEDMMPVFEEFRLTVRLYDCLGRKVYSYDPERKNKNISALFGLIKGNHIYTMNDNISSIAQRDFDENLRLRASTDYRLNPNEAPIKYEMFKSIDDTMKIVKENEDDKEINLVSYDCLNGLNNIYCDFKRAGYEPKITMGAGGRISSLKMKFNKLILNIRSQNLLECDIDNHISVNQTEIFNKVNEAMFKFNKGLFNPSHKSFYHDDDLRIFCKTYSIASSGYMKDIGMLKGWHVEIDKRKAYTKSAMEITKIPVFSRFDIWKKYDYTKNDFNKMSDLTLYYVKGKVKNIFFNKTYNLTYGKFLKHYADVVEIIYYKTPSNVKKVDYKKLIDELWSVRFDEDEAKDKDIKKMIGNINFGLLEKQTNTVRKSIVFSQMIDAFYYQEKYGGDINVLRHMECCDDDGDDRCIGKHYVLNLSDTQTLKNGYKFVKELLLQNHNHSMNVAYERLIKNDVRVYSVKTDAFVVDKCNVGKVRGLLKFGDDIGDWRQCNKFNFPSKSFDKKVAFKEEITEYFNKTGVVKDEWNTREIVEEHILPTKRLMIRGEVAGTGKSYICQYMSEMGYKVVFAVPTNNLKQECGAEAYTINKFFGISYGDERIVRLDYEEYDVIVFDEIIFHSVGKWSLIWDFCLNNPDKIVIATGDTKQLKNPESISNVFGFEEYADHCIDLIFENNIMLYECKRLKTDEDRMRLYDIKRMLFESDSGIEEIVDKHLGWTDGNEICENNIAYTNKTCKEVSARIRKMKKIEDEYVVGEDVICRKYLKHQGKKFNVNFKFKIIQIEGNDFVLQNVATGEKLKIVRWLLRKHFIYAYCYTAHSKQGCSVDSDIVIYDWSKWYCCKNWFWVAITRCRDLNRVKFYKYDRDNRDFSKEMVERYFDNKILKYKEQDDKAGRDIEGEYVDKGFLTNMMNTHCQNCNEVLTVYFEDGKVVSNISCQRVNNDIGHFKDNCIGFCVQCNCAFSNKISL